MRKHQPPQHTQWIVFPKGNSGTLTQESQLHRHTLFGSRLLFKTERILSAIQQTCFLPIVGN